MTDTDKKNPDKDSIFAYETIFPDVAGVFYGGFLGLNDCLDNAFFVLDTNVLLMPYSLKSQSISEMGKVYEKLISEQRFFIPERVAREFAANRASKIAEVHSSIQSKKVGKTHHEFNYPIINDIQERLEVEEALKKYKDAEAEYFKAIDRLLDKIHCFEWSDPVNKLYSSLFNGSIFCTHTLSNDELEVELKRRVKIKQPPGYKDAKKDDGGVGDIAIWLSILELGKKHEKHAIFVSEDGKPDWFKKANGSPFLPRYELIDEYRRISNGKTLHIIKPSKLLEIFEASNNAIEETKTIENLRDKSRIEHFLQAIQNEKEKERANFRKLNRSEKRAEILGWFYSNYADPVEFCPYDSSEGGYQYIWGGPYDAREEIENERSGIASPKLIDEIVEELNEIAWEWSGYPEYDAPDEYNE